MLAGVLGPNQVQVTVSAEMDHDQITHTSEIYDPDGSVTNSVTEKIENTGNSKPSPGGLVGTPVNANASTNNLAGGALSTMNRTRAKA